MKSICVFCGSSPGFNPVYGAMARELGAILAENKISLIYGGGHIGLMGIVAESVMQNGGKVTGIMPRFLFEREIANNIITELIIVESMHERKTKMAQLAGGFIAMPGGFGTLEEVAEIITWAQLNLHQCPVGLLNINSYYDNLISLFDKMVAEGFLDPQNRQLALVENTPALLVAKMLERHSDNHGLSDPGKT